MHPHEGNGSPEDRWLQIAVAGGSIGGLCAGLALHGSGFDVNVYERHPGPMNTRGAGIVVQGELVQLLATAAVRRSSGSLLGSEVSLVVDAHAEALASQGICSRVVSMPSWDIFEHQPQCYREGVSPAEIKARSPSSRDRRWDGSAMSVPPAGSSAWRPSAPPRR